MLRAHDNGRAVKHCAVNFDLVFKAIQRVLVALDFITDEMAVDNSDVSATFTVLQSQFV